MKHLYVIVSLIVLGSGVYAQSPMAGRSSFGAQDLLEQVPGVGNKTSAELTLAERAKLADAFSVAMQERMYVGKAAVASFLVPGLGQFMIGKPVEGSLRLLTQIALVGGAMAGAHYLLPSDFESIRGDRSEMWDYMISGDAVKVLPAWGVMAGGMTLALVNSVFSSRGAAEEARANIEVGRVSFEPILLHSAGGMGMGFRFAY